jgi:hypothetical protein
VPQRGANASPPASPRISPGKHRIPGRFVSSGGDVSGHHDALPRAQRMTSRDVNPALAPPEHDDTTRLLTPVQHSDHTTCSAERSTQRGGEDLAASSCHRAAHLTRRPP